MFDAFLTLLFWVFHGLTWCSGYFFYVWVVRYSFGFVWWFGLLCFMVALGLFLGAFVGLGVCVSLGVGGVCLRGGFL